MAHPVYWPSKTFFYPMGNTSPFCLTQDISPEHPADVLLLGCGDPRNILYTLYADNVVPAGTPRNFDITCCDAEPAILARNILLLSMLDDDRPADLVWAIFYHFKIDDAAIDLLVKQSQTLYDHSISLETCRQSSHGSFIQFVDTRTMLEVRAYWRKYAMFSDIPVTRRNKLLQQQAHLSKSVLAKDGVNSSASRSAGIFWFDAQVPVANLFRRYWETGTTFTLESEVKKAKNLNPTFAYFSLGEVFEPHYGTFPQGFHLSAAFTSSAQADTSGIEKTVVRTIKSQFKRWSDSFRASRAASAIVVRCFSGDALALCRALDMFATTSNPASGISISSWRGSHIDFTACPNIPKTFDVIDTSNLTDHLGLLNILLATRPLLKSQPTSQSVLYTETLLPAGEDTTKSFLDRICSTVPTVSTLLGLAPRAYVSNFTTHSNTHELLQPSSARQYHERVAWVDPSSGDYYSVQCSNAPTMDSTDLAHVVFGIYDKMFANEQIMSAMLARPSLSKVKAMSEIHYHRETIAALLQLLKRRIGLKSGTWYLVMDKLLELVETDRSRLVGMNNYQDLCLQLHLHGIATVVTLAPDWRQRFKAEIPSDIFRAWHTVPPVLCVVLTVPRERLRVLLDDKDKVGTPPLQVHLTAQMIHSNTFSAINMLWGRAISSGSREVQVEEDPNGMNGKSDLVVVFWASSRILEFAHTTANLVIKSTPHSSLKFAAKLGMELVLFGARVDDMKHVQLATRRPVIVGQQTSSASDPFTCFGNLQPSAGPVTMSINVGPGDGPRSVVGFTARVDIRSPAQQQALTGGAEVVASQVGPCTMKLSISSHHYAISYPYPILGSMRKLRVARKSRYVEVIVPVSQPLDDGGYFVNPAPVLQDRCYTPWNMHQICLHRMPQIKLQHAKHLSLLRIHSTYQLSDREHDIGNGDPTTKAAAINTMTNVKETIHTIIKNISETKDREPCVVGLCEPDQGGIYAILLVGGLRLDLASFTVIVDTALVPLSEERMSLLLPAIQLVHNSGQMASIPTQGHEAVAWKRLLPSYVERCRTWTHKSTCEYSVTNKIPLSTKIDQSPICACGEGVGFDGPEWNIAPWKGLLPFATRAAISPLFSVSYIETVAGSVRMRLSELTKGQDKSGSSKKPLNDMCRSCGGSGKPDLLACSRCKTTRYCSSICQHRDWAVHKKSCSRM